MTASRSLVAGMAALGLAGLGLLVWAPDAAGLGLSVEAPPRLIPDVAGDGMLTATFACTELAGAPPGLELTVEARPPHPGLVVQGLGTHPVDPQACLGPAEATMRIPFTVQGSMALLADEPYEVQFTARLQDAAALASIPVTMQYVGGFTLEAPTTTKQVAPQKTTSYPLRLTNLANGPTRFSFELLTPVKGDLVPPNPIQLDAAGSAMSSIVVDVLYSGPFDNGRNHVSDAFTIRVHASSARDLEATTAPADVQLRATTKGFYVPGPGVLGVAAVMAAAAVLRRR